MSSKGLIKRLIHLPIDFCFDRKFFSLLCILLLVFEFLLSVTVIKKVKYTEIDWVAYMEEVEGFLNGTHNYSLLKGQTGPLVYPAGFVYFYSVLYYLSSAGQNVRLIQYVFVLFYLLNLCFVFMIYRRLARVPQYVLIFMCCASYRVHSIYILRLFNDPIAMLFLYGSVCALLHRRTTLSCVAFSFAVSVKMNILLFAPGLLVVLLHKYSVWKTIGHLCECLIVQLVLGLPFLAYSTSDYINCAFNFGRQFLFKWTVNWRFLPLGIFHSRIFHLSLLSMHLLLLLVFLHLRIQSCGGYERLVSFVEKRKDTLSDSDVVYLLFVSNFVGMAFSRSLHYQFYVWYYHTIPFLLWTTHYSVKAKLLIWGIIELCWNTYPSTIASSLSLNGCHCLIVFGLLIAGIAKRQL